jgi:hypothetical protein
MKNRPVVLTVLSVLCLIEPIIKVLYFKATTHFDFVVIFANLLARNSFIDVVDFWLVFPIAGLLLWKLRKWTYFAFLAVLGYINYSMFTYEKYTWPYNSDSPFFYNYSIVLLSALVFCYFLLPKVREPFFDRRVRWWEPKTRYPVDISCKLQGEHVTFSTTIKNISQTGVFVLESKFLRVGDRLLLEFNFLGQTLSVPVEVISKHTTRGVNGFGLCFRFQALQQYVLMTKVIRILKRSQQEFMEAAKVKTAA